MDNAASTTGHKEISADSGVGHITKHGTDRYHDQIDSLIGQIDLSLRTASLNRDAIVSLHLYFQAEALGEIEATSKAVRESLDRASVDPILRQIVPWPVDAVGSGPEMSARLHLEMLAFKQV